MARNRIREQFEEEFWDAHLSKVSLPDDVLEKVIAWCKNPKYILFFCSNPGAGKTYLTAAIANDWEEKKFPWRRFDERKLLSHLRSGIGENIDYEYELRRLCDSPFFILDDLGTAKQTDFQKDSIYDFIDIRWASKKPTIITSNLTIDILGQYFGERFISRMKDSRNTVIEFSDIDKRMNRPCLNDPNLNDNQENE